MATITIPKKEYQNIIQRQSLLEKEMGFLRKTLFELDEINIKPSVLRRWERISRELDRGQGRSFSSFRGMKEWLRNLWYGRDVYRDIVSIIYSREVEDALKKLKKRNKDIFNRVGNQIIKILRELNIGKPLRYTLRNRRRVHVGSFVLIYEFHHGELRFIDFDHHDKIYKKSDWEIYILTGAWAIAKVCFFISSKSFLSSFSFCLAASSPTPNFSPPKL